jgi:hypothetical protein
MPYSDGLMVTIDASTGWRFAMPVPVDSKDIDRETTYFHLVSDGSKVSILGTYDQIMDFCTEIAQKMMSWPIVAGRTDAFFEKKDVDQNGVSDHGRDGSQSAEASGGDGSHKGTGGGSREA